jgi:serine/threonine protein kinase
VSADWAEVEGIFLEVSALNEEAREAALESACAGRAELRKEVESLLAADAARAGFLDNPPSLLAADLVRTQPSVVGPGVRVSSYEILSLVSTGGMGEVYQARQTPDGPLVALKLLRAHLAIDRQALERFQREAEAASSLRHPNIVRVLEFGSSQAGPFLAMEWIDGPTWRAFAQATVPLEQALDLAWQAARGLAAAHDAGIVHRDVKPENIMLHRGVVVKLLDFGLARPRGSAPLDPVSAGSSGTISGTLSGTLPYMSPEILRGEPASAASDVFSFGSVLYELFTASHPFEGATPLDIFEAIECRVPDPPRDRRPELPVELDPLLLSMLRQEQSERPAMGEVAGRLAALRGA